MSKPTIQVAIDAENPYQLARFWAAVTGYEMEDHHEMIGEIIDAGYATLDDTMEIDGRRHWATASACRDTDGHGPRLLFQKVPERKTVKDRIHLDLHFGDGDRDAEVARILALGATKLWDGQQGPQSWVTFADPEGNEFCVA